MCSFMVYFISYIFSIGKLVEIGEPISGVPQSTIVYCWHAPHFRDENSLQRFLLFQQFSFKLVLISNIKETPLCVVLSVPLLKNTNISPAARELFTNNFLSTIPLIHHLHSAKECHTTVSNFLFKILLGKKCVRMHRNVPMPHNSNSYFSAETAMCVKRYLRYNSL